jgi:arginyl-tRNA synthetase
MLTSAQEAKKRFDDDEEFKERSRLNVVKLQAGDATCRAIWQRLCDISRAEFQVVYDALGIRLTEVGESFYNDKIPHAIEKLQQVNLLIF